MTEIKNIDNTYNTEIIEDMQLSKEILSKLKKLPQEIKDYMLLELLAEKEKHLRKISVLNYIEATEEIFKKK